MRQPKEVFGFPTENLSVTAVEDRKRSNHAFFLAICSLHFFAATYSDCKNTLLSQKSYFKKRLVGKGREEKEVREMKCPNCGKMMEAIPVMLSNEARRYKCHTCDIVKVFVFQNGTEENKMKLNAVKKEA